MKKEKLNEFITASKVGFTLIELLVVIAIMGIVMVIGTNIFIGVLRSSNKASILSEIRTEGSRAIELMSRSMANAADLYYPAPADAKYDQCLAYIIVKNKPTNVTTAVGQKAYTRFSFVHNTPDPPTPPTGSYTNNTIALDSSDNVDDLKNDAGTHTSIINDSATGQNGLNVVWNSAAPAEPCFIVRVPPSGTTNVKVISVNFTLEQSKTAPVARNEYRASVPFSSTFTLRTY